MPQILKIILRFFFSGVGSPAPFVKRKRELKERSPKKINAEMLCSHPLIPPSNWNVPTLPSAVQGKIQIHNPNIPASVQIILSTLS